MADNELKIKISADVDNAVSEFKRLQTANKDLRDGLDKLATGATVAFAGLATVIGLSAKSFADFENKMLAVKTAIMDTNVSAEQTNAIFKQMTVEALDLASRVPVSIDSMTKSLFDTVGAGVKAGDAIQFVEQASKLAVAGITDVAVATDGMTSAYNAWGMTAKDTEALASKFFVAQKFGKTTVEQLAGSIGQVSAQASNMGLSIDDVLASVSALTLGGVQTSEAFTQVRGILTAVVKPSAEASTLAKQLGIDFSQAGLNAKGFSGFIKDVYEKTNGSAESMSTLFGRVEALNGALALGGKSADAFNMILGELGNTTKVVSTFQQAYDEQSKSATNQMKLLQNRTQTLLIQLGAEFLPTIIKGVEALSKMVKAFTDLNPVQKQQIANVILFTTGLAGFVAVGATTAKTIITLTSAVRVLGIATLSTRTAIVATTVALATNPFTAWIVGIMALITALSLLSVALADAYSKSQGAKASDEGIIKSHQKHIEMLERRNQKLDESSEAYAKNAREIEVYKKAIESFSERAKAKSATATTTTGGGGTTTTGGGEVDPATGAPAVGTVVPEAGVAEWLAQQNIDIKSLSDERIQQYNDTNLTEQELQQAHYDALFAQQNESKQREYELNKAFKEKNIAVMTAQATTQFSLMANAFGALAGLMASENKTLFEIGKASAIAQMAFQIPLTAFEVYSGFVKAFGAPVGTILGIAGATASVAFGLTKLAEVSQTQFNPSGAKEGIFDFRGAGNNEKLITTLSQGESIIPKSMTEALRSGEASIGGGSGMSFNFGSIIGLDSQDVADKIAQTLNETIQSGRFKPEILQGATS